MAYQVEKSPLYGLKSIHRLADVLQIRVGRLEDTSYLAAQFKEGTVERKGKERLTETPIRSLRRLHNRVQNLLCRIETPDYLHSGKRKRSYLSNAEVHLGAKQMFQVDIAKYYPSCTWHDVYVCFLDWFKTSRDIAGILATLLTYNGHIPTGSPVSSLLSYFSHKPMFDKLHALALNHNIKMSVLQDDVSFSGIRINEEFRRQVREVIKARGLVAKRSKQKYIHGGKAPQVTGVVLTDNGPKAPWCRHRALRKALDDFDAAATETELRKAYQSAIGRLSEIERVQGKLFNLKSRLKKRFRERLLEFKNLQLLAT